MMIKPELQEYLLNDDVRAFSTTRQGGVSTGNYASFNINPYCGDEPQAILENRRLLSAELNIDESRIVLPHQTHETNVAFIDEGFFALSESERKLEHIDAVVTRCKNVCIGVSTADCIPILLYDPATQTAAAVHAGWRGTVARIVEKTIDAMTQRYKVAPQNLKAVIAPGISRDAFEVGDEVYEAFSAADFPMDEIAEKRVKWHIDLPAANYLQLENKGVDLRNIQVCNICTYTDHERFFSARRLGINSGRIYTGIIIKENSEAGTEQ